MGVKKQNRILVFLNDPNKKHFLQICKEITVLLLLKKEIPKYYLKHFYKKEFKNYRNYLGTRHGNLIHNSKKLHKYEHTSLMANKLAFSLYCEKYLLNTPKLIGYNFRTSFFYNNTLEKINTKEDLSIFFIKAFNQSGLDELFIRPLSSLGGKGCFKLKKDDISLESEYNFVEVLKGSFLFTELINQHPEINAIHDKSINTIRLITYIDDNNNVHIIAGLMRFGIGDSVVDNAASGGFFIGINLKDGTLKEKGYRSMEYGGNEVREHPNSSFKLAGFKIPYFKEACELVIKAVQYIPNRFIGWDIALTPNGPILIEANENPDLHMTDVTYDGLLRNPHIKNLIDELD